MRLVGYIACAVVCSLAATTSFAAGNRSAHTLSIAPDPDGGSDQVVTAYWTLEVEPESVPEDFSTDVQLCVDGVARDQITVSITVDPGSGGSCPAAPPCTSGVCGSATIDGTATPLRCVEDDGDCRCGTRIVTEFASLDLTSDENIEIKLVATFGAVPDNDDMDNGVDAPYTGIPLGWNREVEEMKLIRVGEDTYDVEVDASFQWQGHPAPLDLSSMLVLRINGTDVGFSSISAATTQAFADGCTTVGCGSSCGTLNGDTASCAVFARWTCGCGGTQTVVFEDVAIDAGSAVTVVIHPAPNALPELPGFDIDDDITGVCCDDAVSVDDVPADPSKLGQNQPNPFNPTTRISFQSGTYGSVSLQVLDAGGRPVTTLVDDIRAAGTWSVTWDGTGKDGRDVASGVYFYRLSTPGSVQTRRMALIR